MDRGEVRRRTRPRRRPRPYTPLRTARLPGHRRDRRRRLAQDRRAPARDQPRDPRPQTRRRQQGRQAGGRSVTQSRIFATLPAAGLEAPRAGRLPDSARDLAHDDVLWPGTSLLRQGPPMARGRHRGQGRPRTPGAGRLPHRLRGHDPARAPGPAPAVGPRSRQGRSLPLHGVLSLTSSSGRGAYAGRG